MKKLVIKNLVIYFFLIVMIGCCQKENSITKSVSSSDIYEKEIEKKTIDCDLVFNGTYSEWLFIRGHHIYFPLTSLDTLLNKNREGYNNRYLVFKKNWLVLMEVIYPHKLLNEFPLIPLTFTANNEALKIFLTAPGEPLFESWEKIDINHTEIGDDHYRVIISTKQSIWHPSLCESFTCEHIIDFYFEKGIYSFSNDCGATRIWRSEMATWYER